MLLSHVRLYATPWTTQSVEFSRAGTGVGRLSLSRGSSQTRIEPRSPKLKADSLPAEPQGKPIINFQNLHLISLPGYCLMLRNCHRLEMTKKIWQSNATGVPGLDPGTEKGSWWTDWRNPHKLCGFINILYQAYFLNSLGHCSVI